MSRVYFILVWRSKYLLASGYPVASIQQCLFDKCVLQYVQS
jgi:hypothetical protein